MEAKEKAAELVKKFNDFTTIWIDEENCYKSPKKAKQGALIAVDEIIKELLECGQVWMKSRITFWQEVRKQIELI